MTNIEELKDHNTALEAVLLLAIEDNKKLRGFVDKLTDHYWGGYKLISGHDAQSLRENIGKLYVVQLSDKKLHEAVGALKVHGMTEHAESLEAAFQKISELEPILSDLARALNYFIDNPYLGLSDQAKKIYEETGGGRRYAIQIPIIEGS